jgi:hypothetical protein
MKRMFKKAALRIYDVLVSPVTFLYLPLLRVIKLHGIHKFPLNRAIFLRQGIYPVNDHYYEPQIRYSSQFDAKKVRNLHIDLRESVQLSLLQQLDYVEELRSLSQYKGQQQHPAYYLQNGSFAAGDADLYYLMIRNFKPKKIIEIGSGFTTLLSLEAIRRNKTESHDTALICIEPYEFQWLEQFAEIEFKKEKVENIDPSFFSQLEAGDFLFIDSSHVIRPENDVLFEYLEILPKLNKDVIIHIHDIFTPRHYRKEWLVDEVRLWNEQYLLEAFLYFNESFEILFTLNHLKNSYFHQTQSVLTNLTEDIEPGSFWLRKTK